MTLAVIPTRWDRVADVVVVGGGNAGLPAAIVAHDSGADTVIVESNEFLGGLMRGSGGFMFFCRTHVQEQLGIEDRVEWGVEDELILSDFRAVPELVRAYVEEGAQTCQWLEDLGLTWAQDVRDGLSQAPFEQIIYDNGHVANPDLSEYALAGRVDMPADLQISLLENPAATAIHGLGGKQLSNSAHPSAYPYAKRQLQH